MTTTSCRRVGGRPQPLIRSLLLILAVAVGFAAVNVQAQTTAPTTVTRSGVALGGDLTQ